MMMNCPIVEALLDEYAIATGELLRCRRPINQSRQCPMQTLHAKFLVEEDGYEVLPNTTGAYKDIAWNMIAWSQSPVTMLCGRRSL